MVEQPPDLNVLSEWEEVFKQGILAFWVLTSLKDVNLSASEVGQEVSKLTKGMYKPAEQTLYRVLRKYHDLNLVEFKEIAGNKGPMRKIYGLTEFGEKTLRDFTKRNIELFQIDKIKNIISD